MIKSIRLRNLRSFSNNENSPFIEIKPITVLIGKNSSGKSSFLRSLPLLRQSIEVKTGGPILWYGPYVDFGAFSEAKSYTEESGSIFFDFKIKTSVSEEHLFLPDLYFFFNEEKKNEKTLELTVKIEVGETNKKTILRSIEILIDDLKYLITLKNQREISIKLNEEEFNFTSILRPIYQNNNLIPTIGAAIKQTRELNSKKIEFERIDHSFLEKDFSKKIAEEIKPLFHQSTKPETIQAGATSLGIHKKEKIEDELKTIFKKNNTFIKKINETKTNLNEKIYPLCINKNLNLILRSINESINNDFKGVKYIAPLRATAERYYRYQDLQINEMDHTGSNLAMILRSLSEPNQKKFSEWTKENFGFNINVREEGLHYALMIKTDEEEPEHNINDMGFGFSQILPIIASIWMEVSLNGRTNNRKHRNSYIFAIEQPELHLHPEYQAKLSRLFASVVKTSKEQGINIFIIFETHSKTMIETIGDCIEEETLDNEAVNIIFFEKEINTRETKISFPSFDKKGNLKNWPIGFFSGR